MFRKLHKAQWVYECADCQFTSAVSTDLFGAQENRLKHLRTLDHTVGIVTTAFAPIVKAYVSFAEAAVAAFEPLYELSTPAPNLPHDPSLLKDKRTWGGR